MTISDVLIILSTLCGPIAAVQVQKWVERARERRGRQLWIFQTLMATRAMRAGSAEHVQALNSIELFFNGKRNQEKKVRDSWAEYLDFLRITLPVGTPDAQATAHNERGIEFLISLLQALGQALGYQFNQVELKRGAYYPQGHVDDGEARLAIRDGLKRLLSGKQAVKMEITDFPFSQDGLAKQLEVQQALLEVLSGNRALKIQENDSQ